MSRRLEWLLRITVACVFWGRAWQHLRWDAPLWALAWNEAWLEGPVRAVLGMSWHQYATSPAVESAIVMAIRGHGIVYVVCGAAALVSFPEAQRAWRRVQSTVLLLGAVLLMLLAGLYYLDSKHQVGQLIEYSAQWAAPLLLVWVLAGARGDGRLLELLRAAIALTFLGHGLYAVGYYETPGSFVTMMMVGLGVGEDGAVRLLFVAGVLDFVVCAVLIAASVLPRGLVLGTLTWAVAWGTLTAAARVYCNVSPEFLGATLAQWLHESVLRMPHATLPLLLFLLVHQRERSLGDLGSGTHHAGGDTPEKADRACAS